MMAGSKGYKHLSLPKSLRLIFTQPIINCVLGSHAKGPTGLKLVIPEQIPKGKQSYVTTFGNDVADVACENIRVNQA